MESVSSHTHEIFPRPVIQSTNKIYDLTNKQNSVALASKRAIPTERSPLVGEVSANFCG
jgi:hypothetical protein